MPDWKQWRDIADESIKAGREVEQECPRSAISRFYYAAYHAGTAYLLYRRQQPPDTREAWSHADTPDLLLQHLGTVISKEDTKRDLVDRLRQLYKMRCDADYVGTVQPTRSDVDKARKDAGYIVKVIEDVLPE